MLGRPSPKAEDLARVTLTPTRHLATPSANTRSAIQIDEPNAYSVLFYRLYRNASVNSELSTSHARPN